MEMNKNDSVVQPEVVSFVYAPKETHTSTYHADRVVATHPCRLAQTWWLLTAFAARGGEISGAAVAAEIVLHRRAAGEAELGGEQETGESECHVHPTFNSCVTSSKAQRGLHLRAGISVGREDTSVGSCTTRSRPQTQTHA